jgi:hypothetical protein
MNTGIIVLIGLVVLFGVSTWMQAWLLTTYRRTIGNARFIVITAIQILCLALVFQMLTDSYVPLLRMVVIISSILIGIGLPILAYSWAKRSNAA